MTCGVLSLFFVGELRCVSSLWFAEARLDDQDERETQALRAQVAEEKKKLEELTEEETHLQNKQQQLQQKLTQIRAAIKEKEESRPAAGQAQPNNAPAQHVVRLVIASDV